MGASSRVRQKSLYSGFQIPFPLLKQGNLLQDKTLKRICDYITLIIHTDLLKTSCTVLQINLATSIWFTNNRYEILSSSVSVQFSCSAVSDSLRPHELQHARLSCPSPTLSLLKLMSIKLMMPSNHPILWCPLLLPPSIFPSIRVSSNESVLRIRWPKD